MVPSIWVYDYWKMCSDSSVLYSYSKYSNVIGTYWVLAIDELIYEHLFESPEIIFKVCKKDI